MDPRQQLNPWPRNPKEIRASALRFSPGSFHQLKKESRLSSRLQFLGSLALIAVIACDVFVFNGPFIRALVRLAVGP
ncbi:hypothetical protein EON79_10240 [bacterium]|nr:MAG: hypothetical protein EON79_10240 [bacterium]